MDSVRFGRVLGVGARLAGRTLVEAVDAATAPNPGAQNTAPRPEATPRRPQAHAEKALPTLYATGNTQKTRVNAAPRRKTPPKSSLWAPLARSSGVLWLEVTGVFFGMVALAGLNGMWRNNAALHWAAATREVRLHFAIAASLTVVFTYFCASSFLKASRQSKR